MVKSFWAPARFFRPSTSCFSAVVTRPSLILIGDPATGEVVQELRSSGGFLNTIVLNSIVLNTIVLNTIVLNSIVVNTIVLNTIALNTLVVDDVQARATDRRTIGAIRRFGGIGAFRAVGEPLERDGVQGLGAVGGGPPGLDVVELQRGEPKGGLVGVGNERGRRVPTAHQRRGRARLIGFDRDLDSSAATHHRRHAPERHPPEISHIGVLTIRRVAQRLETGWE